MICPICQIREIPIHKGKGRQANCCMHTDCVKRRQAMFYSHFITGKHKVNRRIEFSNDANMEYAIYAG